MKAPNQMSRTATLVESALMIATAFVLSFIPFFSLPWGGSITLVSTLPIILMSLRHGTRWGISTAAVYGILQMLLGIENVFAVPVNTFSNMIFCALLDYILAYTVLGFTSTIAKNFKNPTVGIIVGITSTGILRCACSVISGVLIWKANAPEGWNVWPYSIVYNASWCLPDVALTLVAALVLSRVPMFHLQDRLKRTSLSNPTVS